MTETLTRGEPSAAPSATPPTLRKQLETRFAECELTRPFRRARYDPGDVLDLQITGVIPANTGRVVAKIEKFVGGGFAGQVYRITITQLEIDDGPIAGLEVGRSYAIKILKPPSGLSCLFRNFLYFLAYQGAFSAQVNPAGVRVGVLWQKVIRRAATRKFGRDDAICDTFATFHDADLHSFGEINEWVDGRIWKFEVDDQLFDRWKFDGDPPADANSGEYVHKKHFMDRLVALLHEMGAPELARQYEWWTCKSQPNALKRTDADDSPAAGITAIDFRAGLALLPFLPMSPADFWLILRGLYHGRLVQFDRPDLERFRAFIDQHREDFEGLQPALDELERQEPIHRGSLPDITHNGLRLLTDSTVRSAARGGTITAWRNLGRIDDEHAVRLGRGGLWFTILFVLSMVPLLGRGVLKIWGHQQYRTHLKHALTSWCYMLRAMRGTRIEALVRWHRAERVSDEQALELVNRPVRYWTQRICLGWMPVTWHRGIVEPSFAWDRIRAKARFVLDFLRCPEFRENWLLDQVRLGRDEGMLTPAEADHITEQVKDPYIQKYLKCLAVHICTVPVTQIVMVVTGLAVSYYTYYVQHLEWATALAAGAAVGTAIQLMPISPGSIARGLFVLYLMIRERDIRNYYIAAPVSFLHVVGYLAFPLQMVAHDPALARFMAGRWAKSAVRIIPVFGENGGLPEHAVFDTVFNFPLSLKRRFKERPVGTTAIILAMVATMVYPAMVLANLALAGYTYLRG